MERRAKVELLEQIHRGRAFGVWTISRQQDFSGVPAALQYS
jgi:hypothetical protein